MNQKSNPIASVFACCLSFALLVVSANVAIGQEFEEYKTATIPWTCINLKFPDQQPQILSLEIKTVTTVRDPYVSLTAEGKPVISYKWSQKSELRKLLLPISTIKCSLIDEDNPIAVSKAVHLAASGVPVLLLNQHEVIEPIFKAALKKETLLIRQNLPFPHVK